MDEKMQGAVKSLGEAIGEFVARANPKFAPYAHWSDAAQMLFVFLKDEPGIDVRVDENLTLIMNSRREVIGAKLVNHGLRRFFTEASDGK